MTEFEASVGVVSDCIHIPLYYHVITDFYNKSCFDADDTGMLIRWQGLFCACAQPMRDDVALQHHLSLAGHVHKTIPVMVVTFVEKDKTDV